MKIYNYFIYGNSGGIDEVIKDLTSYKGLRFRTLNEVFDYIADNSLCMKKEDLALKPYCYDARIKKYVFMITTKKIGKEDCYKKYGCPQFAGYYLVEL